MPTINLDHADLAARLRLLLAERTEVPPAVLYYLQASGAAVSVTEQPAWTRLVLDLVAEGADHASVLDAMACHERRCPVDHSRPEGGSLVGLALRLRGTAIRVDAAPKHLAVLAAASAAGVDITGWPGTVHVHVCYAVCADGVLHHALWDDAEPGPLWDIERPGDAPACTGPVRDALERFWAAVAGPAPRG